MWVILCSCLLLNLTNTLPLLHSVSFSHKLTKQASCVSPTITHTHTQQPLMHHWHLLQPLTCLPCHLLTLSFNPPVCQPPWIIHLICPFDKASRCAVSPTLQTGKNVFIYLLCLTLSLPVIVFSSPSLPLSHFSSQTPRCRPLYWRALSQWFAKVDVTGSQPCSCLLQKPFALIEFFHLCFFCMLCLTTRKCFFPLLWCLFPCFVTDNICKLQPWKEKTIGLFAIGNQLPLL